ncbi:MAG: TolC family protein [Saprospiraceae bacterium]|nr:TolC family protein [Saprospiraceae bacterium]
MIFNKQLLFPFLFFFWCEIYSQTNVESVLVKIETNNKSLRANLQYWEARKIEYKTGLSLPNPGIQGQYLIGSPETAGNQTDIFVVQSFDFPTVYKKRMKLAKMQGEISTSSIQATRQDVLLEAKLICLNLIYLHKLKNFYSRRKLDVDKLQKDYQTKLDKGDGNILDLNKIKLQLLENNQLLKDNEVDIAKLQTHLTELNGGEKITFFDSIYPAIPEIKSFEIVEREYEAVDPQRLNLEQEKRIAEKQYELAKFWSFPKFEAGYHYQGILGQKFSGVHAGITLPIWEQKYRTKQEQAKLLFSELNLASHLNEHFFEIKELYDRQASLRNSLDQYNNAISSISNSSLLEKALQLGEINVIEYFLESSFYHNALLHYYKTELEYQIAVAELMKYKL